jgi:hypothetical protein
MLARPKNRDAAWTRGPNVYQLTPISATASTATVCYESPTVGLTGGCVSAGCLDQRCPLIGENNNRYSFHSDRPLPRGKKKMGADKDLPRSVNLLR